MRIDKKRKKRKKERKIRQLGDLVESRRNEWRKRPQKRNEKGLNKVRQQYR